MKHMLSATYVRVCVRARVWRVLSSIPVSRILSFRSPNSALPMATARYRAPFDFGFYLFFLWLFCLHTENIKHYLNKCEDE